MKTIAESDTAEAIRFGLFRAQLRRSYTGNTMSGSRFTAVIKAEIIRSCSTLAKPVPNAPKTRIS